MSLSLVVQYLVQFLLQGFISSLNEFILFLAVTILNREGHTVEFESILTQQGILGNLCFMNSSK